MGFLIGVQVGITSGVAVWRDSTLHFAASEERYTRIKNDTQLPVNAARQAIQLYQLSDHNIDSVILVSSNMSPEHFLCKRESSFQVEDYLKEQYDYYKPRLIEDQEVDYLDVFRNRIDSDQAELFDLVRHLSPSERIGAWNKWRKDYFADLFNVSPSKVVIENHERSHACYGYYSSPLRGSDVLIVTMDGFGDAANATVSVTENGKLKEVKRYKNFNIGRVYRYITLLLRMKPSEHEFKVMGLAPYATEYNYAKALEVFRAAYQFNPSTGDVDVDPALRDNYFYFKDRLRSCRFDGIAGALQLFTEDLVKSLIRYWLSKTNAKHVVLSGGVSLNIKANMEVANLSCVDQIFVAGSGGDESLCIGSIFSFLDRNGRANEINPTPNMYLGEAISDSEIELLIPRARSQGFKVSPGCPNKAIARLLSEGKILGIARGRSEFGARALGHRSIVADPRSVDAITRINYQIKNRDFWMPFTPSILDRYAERYLVNPKGNSYPFMSVACDSTPLARAEIPAALHPADHTARPQIVSMNHCPLYYGLLQEFGAITGVYALLNTSLNLHGLPIAQSGNDAYHVFSNSRLDALIINDVLFERQ